MLTLKGFDKSGKEIALPDYQSIKISREENVPADYMEVTFPLFKDREELNNIIVNDGSELVFKGVCDEIASIKSAAGKYVKIYCRSMFSLLIDNEAIPGSFKNVTAQIIFDRYLKKYGFKKFIADDTALQGDFTVAKGTSVYEVLYDFCRIHYNSIPCLLNEEIISFNGCNRERVITFSDKEIKGFGKYYDYFLISVSKYPCRLISKINIKTSENDFYTTVLHNNFAENKGIVRERCIDSCNESTPMECCFTMFENTNKRYEEYVIHTNQSVAASVGDKCMICDSDFGKLENLYISKIMCRSDKSGTVTEFTLKREC